MFSTTPLHASKCADSSNATNVPNLNQTESPFVETAGNNAGQEMETISRHIIARYGDATVFSPYH